MHISEVKENLMDTRKKEVRDILLKRFLKSFVQGFIGSFIVITVGDFFTGCDLPIYVIVLHCLLINIIIAYISEYWFAH